MDQLLFPALLCRPYQEIKQLTVLWHRRFLGNKIELLIVPTEEVCNAIDDDCNGIIDDGMIIYATAIPL
ncbi:MAG: putative metal-binding motif-containing protein [Bacteroidetes bacterium]|nr:putative metal-binding motif-containing protein [Bacteroidota bacterium]